jgi:hypothetical protein
MDTKVPIPQMSSLPLNAFVVSAQSFHKQQHSFRGLTGLTGVTRSVIIDEVNGERAMNALAAPRVITRSERKNLRPLFF